MQHLVSQALTVLYVWLDRVLALFLIWPFGSCLSQIFVLGGLGSPLFRENPQKEVHPAESCIALLWRHRCRGSMAAADWLQEDSRRLLHAVYRVGDMDATVEYYKKCFGMQLLRYRDVKEEKYM